MGKGCDVAMISWDGRMGGRGVSPGIPLDEAVESIVEFLLMLVLFDAWRCALLLQSTHSEMVIRLSCVALETWRRIFGALKHSSVGSHNRSVSDAFEATDRSTVYSLTCTALLLPVLSPPSSL